MRPTILLCLFVLLHSGTEALDAVYWNGTNGGQLVRVASPSSSCPSTILNGNTSVLVGNYSSCGLQPLLNFSVNSPGSVFLGLQDSTITIDGNITISGVDLVLPNLPTQTSSAGFNILTTTPSSGAVSQVPALPAMQSDSVLLVGDTTYTPPPGTQSFLVECVGGGGGGGGVSTTGAGGGGGSGSYGRVLFTAPFSSPFTVSVGTGGAGGGPGVNGSPGTSTVFGGIALCTGGDGGSGQPSSTAPAFVSGGAGGLGSALGDFASSGQQGSAGLTLSGTVVSPGLGAPSLLGGSSSITRGDNFGSGGNGAASVGAGVSGDPGIAGVIFVWEFS